MTIFGNPGKIVVDNGGEFCNKEFITFCENLNVRICTTATESPWSNGLVERHNAVLGLTVSKTMEDAHCDLNIALAWGVSAKNALKMYMGFHLINLCLVKTQVFLTSLTMNFLH